ncbi:MAG: cupredoxin domain-containing protein [Chloroflexi bacterium]|nr:cupredoxin domain-containing protein [Chloroflexota bacterium]
MIRSRAILLLLVLAGLVVAFAPLPVQPHTPVARVFRVEASQFTYSPAEISVNPGDIVTIELASADVVHGLYVDGYDVSVQADPGQTATLSFIADRPGAFRMRCNVTCGAMHPFMIGKLNVGVNTWLYRSIALAFIGFISVFILSRRESDKIQA